MKGYPEYLGCIASDEISRLRIKPQSRFGFVMNTDPHNKPGTHWVAVYVDARSNGSHSIEYYNSLADQQTRQIFDDLKELAERSEIDHDLIFKLNRVADQSDDSANCGYFASKFLIDRFNGQTFAQASGYNKQFPQGEKMIEKWKTIENNDIKTENR